MIQHTSTIPPEFFERRRQVGEYVSALMLEDLEPERSTAY
ncbi:hypothetical protein SAMN02745225_00486 [Ferrithrix thermotolerans DSM 19514]|uniref:Uncharacterized protein n=1 Tax=Ferrithrix thermotolerans DSM 19514 TaxID=1121881 RepID=A0A1M4T3Z2_9ACTN|nr:hypothetical protein SAMN02745225_00486 [Ferrithrix thermotolerans DSM 19514]